MYHPKTFLSTKRFENKSKDAGMVSLPEAMIAGAAASLIIGASAMGLQATSTLINQSSDKQTLRQNTMNGMRLMRSEIERSIHLVINNANNFSADQERLDLSSRRYSDTLARCDALAGNYIFKPIFGAKMIELSNPVIYGISTNPNGYGYALKRCGAPLKLDGNYNDETEKLFISTILEDIGKIPCAENSQCEPQKPLRDYLETINFTFNNGFTPFRTTYEPALRIETDSNFKLIKFVDPSQADPDIDNITASYLEKSNNTKSLTKQDLNFAAFARADKRINNENNDGAGGILGGAFFQNVTSDRVRFAVDGSGSMSACVMWGDGYAQWRKFYKPGHGYFNTNRKCAFTRMEMLQKELAVLLENLPDDTRIGIRSFSSSGYSNHKIWKDYGTKLKRLGDEGVRESATSFVYSLDDDSPTSWGGTNPWSAIKDAFNDPETDALYFLSDGQPNRDRNGGYWSSSDEEPTANYYSGLNQNRDIVLKVHSTALGLESEWMRKLSDLTGGAYNEVNRAEMEDSN